MPVGAVKYMPNPSINTLRDASIVTLSLLSCQLGQSVAEANPTGGTVASGTMSPSLGIGVGMAYVPAASAEPGTLLAIDVRGRERAAEIVRKPIYRREEQ